MHPEADFESTMLVSFNRSARETLQTSVSGRSIKARIAAMYSRVESSESNEAKTRPHSVFTTAQSAEQSLGGHKVYIFYEI